MQSIPLAITALSASLLLAVIGFRPRKVTLIGLLAALLVLPFFPHGPAVGLFSFDLFAVFFAAIFLSVAFLAALASDSRLPAFYASVLLATLGMIVAASANDLLAIFLGVELLTAPGYLLVFLGKTAERTEAAVKYFVVSILASALLLLGIVLLAADGGSTNLSRVAFTGSPVFLIGFAAALAGLGFKMRIFPFNFWTPDVYQGAPPGVPGFLAGAGKKAGFAAFIRLAVVVVPFIRNWTVLIAVLAALTMTIPNLTALVQRNLRRLLAYSIMTHAGFLLMGLAILSPLAVSGTLVHTVTHAFMALGAFLVAGVLQRRGLHEIVQLRGFGWRHPFLAASLTVFLLSLAGIPLLAGFASKFYLFYGVAREGLLVLTVIAVANSVISLYYYFRVIRAMYGYPAAGKVYGVPRGTAAAILVCLLLTVLIGLYPLPLYDLALAAAGMLV